MATKVSYVLFVFAALMRSAVEKINAMDPEVYEHITFQYQVCSNSIRFCVIVA